ncbi:MAG: hypothetical protein ABFC79_01835 [Candidatus Cryosericum sp.]|nr:hypothetical protein [Candidatus Cryosericum sp.]HPS69514.1 hypothetical protein [Candidatus Cryosericum sp.]
MSTSAEFSVKGSATARQKEFIASLEQLCSSAGGPVSYEDVAADMGVSKWTAYDILRKLYDSGLVEMEHEVRTTRGRARLLFAPAPRLAGDRQEHAQGEDGTAIRQWVTDRVKQYARYGIARSINVVVRRLERERNPLQIILYTTVLVLVFAEVFSVDVGRVLDVRGLLTGELSSDVVLGVLGEVMFSLMRDEQWVMANLGLSTDLLDQFAECGRMFFSALQHATAQDKKIAVSVLQESLLGGRAQPAV